MERGKHAFDIMAQENGGILLFCLRGKERDAVKELLHLIDDIAGEFVLEKNDTAGKIPMVTEELERELAGLRGRGQSTWYKLKDPGSVPCIAYITPNMDSNFPRLLRPLPLCYKIWDVMLSKSNSAHTTLRCVERLLPLEKTCHANITDIQKMMERLLFVEHGDIFRKGPPDMPILPQHQTSYAIFINSRCHDTVKKSDIIDMITTMLQSAHCVMLVNDQKSQPSMLYVDLKSPKISICVELLKNTCGTSIVMDYISKYKRGNVHLQDMSDSKLHKPALV